MRIPQEEPKGVEQAMSQYPMLEKMYEQLKDYVKDCTTVEGEYKGDSYYYHTFQRLETFLKKDLAVE